MPSAPLRQQVIASAALAGAACIVFLCWQRRRRAAQPAACGAQNQQTVHEVLAVAEAAVPFADSSPIYHAMNRGASHSSDVLLLQYHKPDDFEPLDVRLFQRDVAKGCIDPDVLGTDAGRDWVVVAARCGGPNSCAWRELKLPAFLAHLATPAALFEPELDQAIIAPLYEDGTFTGSLLWD